MQQVIRQQEGIASSQHAALIDFVVGFWQEG